MHLEDISQDNESNTFLIASIRMIKGELLKNLGQHQVEKYKTKLQISYRIENNN